MSTISHFRNAKSDRNRNGVTGDAIKRERERDRRPTKIIINTPNQKRFNNGNVIHKTRARSTDFCENTFLLIGVFVGWKCANDEAVNQASFKLMAFDNV